MSHLPLNFLRSRSLKLDGNMNSRSLIICVTSALLLTSLASAQNVNYQFSHFAATQHAPSTAHLAAYPTAQPDPQPGSPADGKFTEGQVITAINGKSVPEGFWEHRKFLAGEMEKYFFGDGSEKPAGYVAPAQD